MATTEELLAQHRIGELLKTLDPRDLIDQVRENPDIFVPLVSGYAQVLVPDYIVEMMFKTLPVCPELALAYERFAVWLMVDSLICSVSNNECRYAMIDPGKPISLLGALAEKLTSMAEDLVHAVQNMAGGKEFLELASLDNPSPEDQERMHSLFKDGLINEARLAALELHFESSPNIHSIRWAIKQHREKDVYVTSALIRVLNGLDEEISMHALCELTLRYGIAEKASAEENLVPVLSWVLECHTNGNVAHSPLAAEYVLSLDYPPFARHIFAELQARWKYCQSQ